jgi:hypothetical protein
MTIKLATYILAHIDNQIAIQILENYEDNSDVARLTIHEVEIL